MLKDGGYLFLELEDYSSTHEDIMRSGGCIRKWEQFDPSDPFEFCLDKIYEDGDANIVFEKTFISRNSDGRRKMKNVIKNYTRKTIISVLNNNGFDAEIFPVEQLGGQGEFVHNFFRVLARKTKGIK